MQQGNAAVGGDVHDGPGPATHRPWRAAVAAFEAHPRLGSSSRSPWGGISELSMNAALAMIEAAAPKDEIEGALAVQMACTHTAAMAVLAKLDVAFATERRVAAFGSAAARLMRAYATQVEVLRRLRNGGHQYVQVEHVQINDGGQAVIGNVKKQDVQD